MRDKLFCKNIKCPFWIAEEEKQLLNCESAFDMAYEMEEFRKKCTETCSFLNIQQGEIENDK